MYRSRVSLAITDAAAIAAEVESPPITARCANPRSPSAKPSDRQMQSSRATPNSASRRAARLVTCRPRSSIPGAQRETMRTLTASLRMTGYSSARALAVCCLESLRPDSERMSAGRSRSWSNRTAAATSGPARQPRPASSAPATNRGPSARSWRNSFGPGRRLPAAARRRCSGGRRRSSGGRWRSSGRAA